MNDQSLNDVKGKAQRTLNQDGLIDVFFGLSCLAIAVYMFFNHFMDENIIVLVIFPALLMGPILQKLRNKFTYNRIGYVDLHDKRIRRVIILAILLFLFLGLAVVMKYVDDQNTFSITKITNKIPHALAIIFVFIFLFRSLKYGIKRYYIYALLMILCTVFIFLGHYHSTVKFIITFAILSVTMIATGLFTFFRFIKRVPVRENSSEIS